MDKQQYEQAVLEDSKEWIDENIEYYDCFESARDDMELVVTGNDNGSYYCSTYKAEQALKDIVFDNSIADALKFELGIEGGLPLDRGAETCDVLVRFVCFYEQLNTIEKYFDKAKEAQLATAWISD